MNHYISTLIIVAFTMRHVGPENFSYHIENHPAWKEIDLFECGFSASDRIIGGLNAALGQFPWMARLGYTVKGDQEVSWMCGGSLVTDRHVVTAAHCVKTAEEDFELSIIRIGEYDTKNNPDCQLNICAPPLQDRKIQTIKIHPSYNKPLFHNDLAMIILDEPVQLNDYVIPICLPRGDQLQRLDVNEHLTVAGWGKMNMTTEEKARILQYVSIPVIKAENCNFFGKEFKLTEKEICAGGQRNKDACVGDSGGPLMKVLDTLDGPKNFLMGVVSFGPTICGIKKPGVYTSIPHFLKWILDNITL